MITDYIEEVKAKLITSKIIRSFSVITEQILEDQGYFGARLWLINGDFLEVAEYFKVINGKLITDRYRYQWMDKSQRDLRKRWDYRDWETDRKSTRLNSSHSAKSRMPSSA